MDVAVIVDFHINHVKSHYGSSDRQMEQHPLMVRRPWSVKHHCWCHNQSKANDSPRNKVAFYWRKWSLLEHYSSSHMPQMSTFVTKGSHIAHCRCRRRCKERGCGCLVMRLIGIFLPRFVPSLRGKDLLLPYMYCVLGTCPYDLPGIALYNAARHDYSKWIHRWVFNHLRYNYIIA